MHHQAGLVGLFLFGQRLVLFAQLHILQGSRDIRVPGGVQHQPHGIVFPAHQVHGFIHGRLQLGQGRGIGGVLEHDRQCMLPPALLFRLPEIILQVRPVPHNGVALNLFRQVIGGVHQVVRGGFQLNIIPRRVGQGVKRLHRADGGIQQDGHNDRGQKEHKPGKASQ